MTKPYATPTRRPNSALENSSRADMIWIPGGTYRMGSDRHYADEAPVHRVTIDDFWIDRFPLSNSEFHDFVRARARPPG
jgi:formylglycine-generating enzyme